MLIIPHEDLSIIIRFLTYPGVYTYMCTLVKLCIRQSHNNIMVVINLYSIFSHFSTSFLFYKGIYSTVFCSHQCTRYRMYRLWCEIHLHVVYRLQPQYVISFPSYPGAIHYLYHRYTHTITMEKETYMQLYIDVYVVFNLYVNIICETGTPLSTCMCYLATIHHSPK